MTPQKRTGLAAIAVALALIDATPVLADGVEQAAANFAKGKGFAAQKLENIDGALDDLIKADPAAMIPADASISPVEKALLWLEVEEEPLQRGRYLLRYSQRTIDNVEVSFIDVQRYNLGPAIHDQTVGEYGAENTAPVEAFGTGPNVEWRFVTQPTAKEAALLLAASRREISAAAAAATDCLPRKCLSTDPLDDLAPWSEGVSTQQELLAMPYPATTPSQFDDGGEELAPAYQAYLVALAAGIAKTDTDGTVWTMPERQGGDTGSPILVLTIDRNLGNDTFSDAAIGIAKLTMDGDERWTRISSGFFDGKASTTLQIFKGPLVVK